MISKKLFTLMVLSNISMGFISMGVSAITRNSCPAPSYFVQDPHPLGEDDGACRCNASDGSTYHLRMDDQGNLLEQCSPEAEALAIKELRGGIKLKRQYQRAVQNSQINNPYFQNSTSEE